MNENKFEILNKYKTNTRNISSWIICKTDHIESITLAPNKYIQKPSKFIVNQMVNIAKTYNKLARGISKIPIDFAKWSWNFARKTNTPFNFVWLQVLKMRFIKGDNLLFSKGVLFLVALMGGGKSSLLYHLIEELRLKTGKGAYVNIDLEYAHYDEFLDKDVQYHNRFEMEEFWNVTEDENGKKVFKQLKRFNKRYPTIVLDEWLSKMNHRSNMSSEYKAQFIPFITSLSHMRHQGIDRVYVASQISSTDIQLMSMFKLVFEIEIVTGIPYWEWVKTGSLGSQIVGWKITAKKPIRKNGNTELKKVKSWFKRKTVDMSNFCSLNMAGEYENLPYDNLKKARAS